MANTKISQLPLFTGNTSGSYLVMNNSGQTQTFKVTRESIIGASGTSGTSGTSGSSGASGSSGSSGTSGSNGSSGSSGAAGASGSSGSSGTSGTSAAVNYTGLITTGSYGGFPQQINGSLTVTSNNSIDAFAVNYYDGISQTNQLRVDGFGITLTAPTSSIILTALKTNINGITNVSGSANITGSLSISGNTTITGSLNVSGAAFSDVNINGRISVTTPNGSTTIGGNITPNLNIISGSVNASLSAGNFNLDNEANRIELTSNATTGNKTQIRTVDDTLITRTIVELPCSSSWNGGLTKFKYPVEITGSVNISTVMTLAQQSTLPSGTVGSLAVSGSNLFYHNGSSWSQIN